MNEADALRPKGTVEVRCSYPGCNVAWWVDPLDPKLPGPFNCGDDHEARKLVDRALSRLRIEIGHHWGTMVATGPERPFETACSSRSISSGACLINDRYRGRKALLEWSSPEDLATVPGILARLKWDLQAWPEAFKEWVRTPQTEPGKVRTVNYQWNDSRIRRYTFAKCARSGCPHNVMVDYDMPSMRLGPNDTYSVGAWGGDDLPEPSWWDTRKFRCGEGLSTSASYPCEIVHGSEALADFERTGIRWTMWNKSGHESGTVLFHDPEARVFGGLVYASHEVFSSKEAISRGIHWSSARGVYLHLSAAVEGFDDIVHELGSLIKV